MKSSFMVNNSLRARMCFCTSLLLFFFFRTDAQDISKYYSSRFQDNSNLYFIYEQDGFKNEFATLVYDVTYFAKSDSATLNFSIVSKNDLSIESIQLTNDSLEKSSKAIKLYIESKKDDWIYRYSGKFLYSDLQKFFEKSNPSISISGIDDVITFTIKPSKWKDQSAITRKIFALINHNR